MNFIELIANGKLTEAKSFIFERLEKIVAEKLEEKKVSVADDIYEWVEEELDEANVMKMGRTKLIRRRIRQGKVQKNIRKSAVKGYTLKAGKLRRITAIQRVHMSRTQKRAARKRKTHIRTTVRKRARSILRRKTMGIK